MKRFYILCLLVSAIGFSQQGINYKAVIQDGGQIVANTPIALYFTVKENGTNDVYKETHTITSNENGIVVANIGEGIASLGSFEAIDWTKEQFLNVGVDIGNGLVDLGTTAFKQVPYALHAKTAEVFTGTMPNAGNLVKVTENGREGYRLVDAPATNHGNIGDDAIDLSFQESTSEIKGATEAGAFASGYSTEASGEYSVAFGYTTKASDTYATSFGAYTEASGYASSSFGIDTKALGYYSSALGRATTAESYLQTTIGGYNTARFGASSTFVATDPLFIIGNGTNSNNKSDALVVLKNGNTEINGTLTIDALNDDDGYTLPTAKGQSGEVLMMNNNDSGTHWAAADNFGHLERVSHNFDYGYRLLGSNPNNYGNIGDHALDLSISTSAGNNGATGDYAVAIGRDTQASGINSVVLGSNAKATGDYSTALGRSTQSTNYASTAIGFQTQANGFYSTAIGVGDTKAIGNYSTAIGAAVEAQGNFTTAMGFYTVSESFNQTTMGMYNTSVPGSPDLIVATDRLFVLGNGTSETNTSDAIVVLKNGNTTINGELNVDEVQATDSGNADMKAYIYGLVTISGGISSASSSGFTITKTGTGSFRVVFNNPPSSYTNYMVVSSLHGDIGFVETVRNTTYIAVNTYDTSGTLTDKSFNFVVFKK